MPKPDNVFTYNTGNSKEFGGKCQHCGATMVLSLPIDARLLGPMCLAFSKGHQKCQPKQA